LSGMAVRRAFSEAPKLRRERLRKCFRRAGIDALLATEPNNVRYLTGFTGDDSALLVTAKGNDFVTDGRYTTQAGKEIRGSHIITRKKGMMETVAILTRAAQALRLGVEAGAMTLSVCGELRSHLRDTQIIETNNLVEDLRIIKDASELQHIEKAIAIAESAFAQVRLLVRPGVTERQLGEELDARMRRLGADDRAFPTIVLAAERAALPHGQPSDRRIREGDLVLFDWGARRNFYCCDLTRVVFVHRISTKQRAVYEAVLSAQKAALRKVAAGVSACEPDVAARESLKRSRRSRFFTHSLGHGVGLQIHEAPGLRSTESRVLRSGMVVTVEPGVYLPGYGGVRIEDMVLVTSAAKGGCRLLTSAPKALSDIIV
jgi:Xaa-Pro aminopeptidase